MAFARKSKKEKRWTNSCCCCLNVCFFLPISNRPTVIAAAATTSTTVGYGWWRTLEFCSFDVLAAAASSSSIPPLTPTPRFSQHDNIRFIFYISLSIVRFQCATIAAENQIVYMQWMNEWMHATTHSSVRANSKFEIL